MVKKVLIIISLLWLSVGVAYAKIEVPKGMDDRFRAFLGDEAAGRRLKIAELKAISKQKPDDCELYMAISLGSDLAGEYQEELKYLLLEEKCHPRDYADLPVVWNNIARAYLLLNRPDEAKPWMDKGAVQGEDDYFVLRNKASFYMAKKDWAEAGKALKTLDEKSNKDEDVYYQWFVDLSAENYSAHELIEIFQVFLKVNPNAPNPKRALALAIRGVSSDVFSETCPKAINFLKKSFKEHPHDWLLAKSLAASYQLWYMVSRDKSHIEQAYTWIEKSKRLNPGGSGVDYFAGIILNSLGKYQGAIMRGEEALSREPDSESTKSLLSGAYNNAAYKTYKEDGDLNQALIWADRALGLSVERVEYLLETRASILYKMGRVAEAWEDIQKAYAIDPDQEDVKKTYAVISKAMAAR